MYAGHVAFHVKNSKADQALRELQAVTGESLTEAVTRALEERLAREKRLSAARENDPLAVLQETWQRLAQIPIRDSRPVDEILGYGEDGLLT